MVRQIGRAFRREIGQDRDDDGLIGVDGQVSHAPARTVTGTEGDLFTFLNTGFTEKDVEAEDIAGHVGIGERLTADVVQGRLVPELPCGSLKPLKIMWIGFHNGLVSMRSGKSKHFFLFMYYLCSPIVTRYHETQTHCRTYI